MTLRVIQTGLSWLYMKWGNYSSRDVQIDGDCQKGKLILEKQHHGNTQDHIFWRINNFFRLGLILCSACSDISLITDINDCFLEILLSVNLANVDIAKKKTFETDYVKMPFVFDNCPATAWRAVMW